MAKKKEIRATADGNSVVGMQRYRTYKASISRIKKAIEEEYYLEAITLCESLIADRLEHRLKYLTKSDKFSFGMLFNLQKKIEELEPDGKLNVLVNEKLHLWRRKRNDALHAMAKIEDGDSREWEDKLLECKVIAKEGEELRKEVFKYTRLKK
jgi:hypothetical protein